MPGAKIPKDRIIDGIDLSDLILGKTKTSKRKEFFIIYVIHWKRPGSGDCKLHVAKPKVSRETEDVTRDASVIPKPVIDDDVEVRELYNLRDDPGETNNLYDEYPDIVEMIMGRIRECREDIGDAFTSTKGKNVRNQEK